MDKMGVHVDETVMGVDEMGVNRLCIMFAAVFCMPYIGANRT